MTSKVRLPAEMTSDDPVLRKRVKDAWAHRGGGHVLPDDADLISPGDLIPGLWGAYWASWEWYEPEEGYVRGDEKSRFLRALTFCVESGERASVGAAARNAGMATGTVRSWMHRDSELHEKARRILEGGFDYSELWPEESTVKDLERLACLPGVDDDIGSLRAGRGPSKAFLDVAHRGVLPEDTLRSPPTYLV